MSCDAEQLGRSLAYFEGVKPTVTSCAGTSVKEVVKCSTSLVVTDGDVVIRSPVCESVEDVLKRSYNQESWC